MRHLHPVYSPDEPADRTPVTVAPVARQGDAPVTVQEAVTGAATRPAICVVNGDALEVHALEGTYRLTTGSWVFTPVQFPRERITVRDLDTLGWLARTVTRA